MVWKTHLPLENRAVLLVCYEKILYWLEEQFSNVTRDIPLKGVSSLVVIMVDRRPVVIERASWE